MVVVCLPSDALSQHLLPYLGFSYLRRGVSIHGCSSKAQLLLLTLDGGIFSQPSLLTLNMAKDGEALYSQQKQDQDLTVAQIMNSLLLNTDVN